MKKLVTLFTGLALLCTITIALGKAPKGMQFPPSFVETTTVKFTSRQQQVAATGTLNAIPGIVIKPEISGRITKMYFKSGDAVAKGAPIIEINPDIIKAQLAQAQATLQLTKLNYERAVQLYKTHDISKADFDKSTADYNSAKASVDQAKAQLQQTVILAPFNGKLGLSQVNLGDFVSPSTEIVNLQSIDPIYVDFSIPEVYVSKVARGQNVLVRTDAYPGVTFNGKVEALESAINQANRTLMLRASIPNKDGKLIPGTFVEVSVLINQENQVIEIPQTAVVFSPEGNFVYRVVDGKAAKTIVTLGDRDADKVVVKTGLNSGDIIITSGQLKVQDGSPVMTAPPQQEVKK